MADIGVAVVTGGGSGIGRALCERLDADGARVVVVDRDGHAARRVARELRGATAFAVDVRAEAEVRALVDEVERGVGAIDLYCSNAGIGTAAGLGSDEDWSLTWSVHLLAHVYAARAVLPGMAQRGGGRMVLTASAAGLLTMMQSAPYTVTKHATVALAEWLAIAWGDQGIQLACLCPQGVNTPMLGDPTAAREVAASGAILEPADVADEMMEALAEKRFLVLPHPEVHRYEVAKVADRDRWLAGMRKLARRVTAPGNAASGS